MPTIPPPTTPPPAWPQTPAPGQPSTSPTWAGREERLGFQPVVPAFNRGLSGLSPFVVKPVGGFQPRGSTAFSLRSTFPGFQPPTVNPKP